MLWQKSCGIPGGKNGEVNPYEWRKIHIYCQSELLLSFKDMAPNYSKLARVAFFVHEQLLTVILTFSLLLLEKGIRESNASGCTMS